MKRLAVLISGRGSNFLAISDACENGKIDGSVTLVISNRQDATGLTHAVERGYATRFIRSKDRSREDFDRELLEELEAAEIDFVCLAGFMRLLSPVVIAPFRNRILNIHPSLLPAFPGLHAQRQALEWGVKVSGCTVHFVDEELDHGPILLQRTVPVLEDDTEETLSDRILVEEHRAYPEAVRMLCAGNVKVQGRRVRIL